MIGAAAVACLLAAGCQSSLFRSEGDVAFVRGTIPAAAPGPDDAVIGQAANEPGRCIYRTPGNRRLRADCPSDFTL